MRDERQAERDDVKDKLVDVKHNSYTRVEATAQAEPSAQRVPASSLIPHPSSLLPPSSLRVLLWDIDGTLVRSARQGAFVDYTRPALERVFGTAGRLAELSVSGMTDLQIAAEALRDEGFTPEQIRARSAELCAHYCAELERITTREQLYLPLPGAREALTSVAAHPRYRNALLTGNVERAADLKLRLTGLADFFQLPGAFGDDSHDRRELPALAAARISRHLKLDLAPAQFIVIGDTPNDIACARHFGARAIAVATGRSYPAHTLRPHHPDALLPDLTDTAALLHTLAQM
jgi:phosphoglycolate phosphatase-like HAD superfamily hydrolase